MNNITDHKSTGDNIPVKRGKVDSLTVYEVTEYELDHLEKGSPASLFLNFSILFITVGVSFLIALLTTSIESDRLFNVFVIITVVNFIAGLVLIIIWIKSRRVARELIKTIKDRCPLD